MQTIDYLQYIVEKIYSTVLPVSDFLSYQKCATPVKCGTEPSRQKDQEN